MILKQKLSSAVHSNSDSDPSDISEFGVSALKSDNSDSSDIFISEFSEQPQQETCQMKDLDPKMPSRSEQFHQFEAHLAWLLKIQFPHLLERAKPFIPLNHE